MTHLVVIDRTLCSGLGACVSAGAGSVRLGPDGIAVACGPISRDRAEDVARSCPMGAVTVVPASARPAA